MAVKLMFSIIYLNIYISYILILYIYIYKISIFNLQPLNTSYKYFNETVLQSRTNCVFRLCMAMFVVLYTLFNPHVVFNDSGHLPCSLLQRTIKAAVVIN